MIDHLERQLAAWKKVLLVFCGADAALLLITLTELPMLLQARDSVLVLSGWYAVWFLLEIGSLAAGLTLLVAAGWRPLPVVRRKHTAFGFLGVAWISLLAFTLRTLVLSGTSALLAPLIGGVMLVIAWLLVQVPAPAGDIFP